MNSLERYVNSLFKGYKNNEEIMELKAEILSNLEAKVADLQAKGTDYDQAVKLASENFDSDNVDSLIDGNKKIYVNRYKLEFLQLAFLYVLVAWIVTIPFRIAGMGIVLNGLLLIAAIVVGAVFYILNAKKKSGYNDATSFYNIKSAMRYKKVAWLVWGLFVITTTVSITAIQFGSNIWFSRPIGVSGPYQVALLVIRYALPFVSIIIPMLFSTCPKLIDKYKVGEENENYNR